MVKIELLTSTEYNCVVLFITVLNTVPEFVATWLVKLTKHLKI